MDGPVENASLNLKLNRFRIFLAAVVTVPKRMFPFYLNGLFITSQMQ